MVQDTAEMLAGLPESPVVEETAADEGASTATIDAEDTQDAPKRGGPRYKDLYAQTQKELETLRNDMARKDAENQKAISDAARAVQEMVQFRQQEQVQQSIVQSDRQIEAKGDQLADQRGWDTYQRAEWVEEQKAIAREKAEIAAEKRRIAAEKEAATDYKRQADAIKARPRQVAVEIATITDKFASRYKLDKDTLKIDPVQVIAKLTKDPWEPGAVEEAQGVIRDLLDDAKDKADSTGRQNTLAQRAANGTDVMPSGGSGSLDWRSAIKGYASDPDYPFERFLKAMATAPLDERRKYGLAD